MIMYAPNAHNLVERRETFGERQNKQVDERADRGVVVQRDGEVVTISFAILGVEKSMKGDVFSTRVEGLLEPASTEERNGVLMRMLS